MDDSLSFRNFYPGAGYYPDHWLLNGSKNLSKPLTTPNRKRMLYFEAKNIQAGRRVLYSWLLPVAHHLVR